MKLLVPLILLIAGVGAGVGTALLTGAEASLAESECAESCSDAEGDGSGAHAEDPIEVSDADAHADPDAAEYARFNNQFIIPVIQNERVSALVVLTLAMEVTAGQQALVLEHEPRVRDALLQVLWDHANQGGFDAVLTANDRMATLRAAMRNVARSELGPILTDVLILELIRQDVVN